ncbi:MAG TPA: hypothetical protein VJS92_10335 [Candidatus Polarisedimenticolaceae bacterium]|nr:hypothetical protein [Candidatus Polarisedimenticolaceae bacterium]
MRDGARTTRVFLLVGGGLVLLGASCVGAAAAAVHYTGSVSCRIEAADGTRISLAVPTLAARLGLSVVPDAALQPLARELRPYLPTLREVAAELARTPDFVLLEVVGRDGHVRIEKLGGALLVAVQSGGDRVNVRVPLGTVGAVVGRLDAACRDRV